MTKRIVGFLVAMSLLVGMMAGGRAEKLRDAADFKSDKPSSEWKLPRLLVGTRQRGHQTVCRGYRFERL